MSKIVALVVKRLRASKAEELVKAMLECRAKVGECEERLEEANAAIKQFGKDHPFAKTAKGELPQKKKDLAQVQANYKKIRNDLRALINNSLREIYPLQVWERLTKLQKSCQEMSRIAKTASPDVQKAADKVTAQVSNLMNMTEKEYGPFPTPGEMIRTVRKNLIAEAKGNKK